jgi:hypothetical protein
MLSIPILIYPSRFLILMLTNSTRDFCRKAPRSSVSKKNHAVKVVKMKWKRSPLILLLIKVTCNYTVIVPLGIHNYHTAAEELLLFLGGAVTCSRVKKLRKNQKHRRMYHTYTHNTGLLTQS